MNGNLEIIDNAAAADGTHKNFIMLQREVKNTLLHDSAAFACYMHLLDAGNGYNVTVKNIARDLQCAERTAKRALEVLKAHKLLKQEADKDRTGKTVIDTGGRRIPNNQQHFALYALPYNTPLDAQQQAAPQLEPFAGSEVTPHTPTLVSQPVQASSAEVKAAPPPAVPAKQAAGISIIPGAGERFRPANGAEMLRAKMEGTKEEERRKLIEQVQKDNGLNSEKGKKMLAEWARKYKAETGRLADKNALTIIADSLSNNLNNDLSNFIRREKLKFVGQ